jgi:hypothetical protein
MKTGKIITRSNYEAYMVDHWDGTLSPDLTEALMLFLDQNPDIKRAVMDAGRFTLPEEPLHYDEKNALFRKEVGHENIDEFLVNELEQDLLPHEQNELNLFIASNPGYQKDRQLYALTKVRPDRQMIYPHKDRLQRGVVRPMWIRYSSVAAAACMFLVAGLWWASRPQVGGEISSAANQPQIQNQGIASSPSSEIPNDIVSTPQNTISTKQRMAIVTVVPATTKEKPSTALIPVKDASENFHNYARSRKDDDYLGGLIDTYLPPQYNVITNAPENEKEPGVSTPPAANNKLRAVAAGGLYRVFKDSALVEEIGSQTYSVKTKVAKTVAWATGKAFGGKLKAEAIPYNDGSLAAMSFSNGKYNYTKRF